MAQRIGAIGESVDTMGESIDAIGESIDGLPTFNTIYPVGSIYMSMTDTSPASLFGGTWERIGVGRTLLSAGGDENAVSDTNTYTGMGNYTGVKTYFPVDEKGGEIWHTLTVAEMPSHKHTITTKFKKAYGQSGSTRELYHAQGEYSLTSMATASDTGGGGQHNNLPPYLAVYMWKRIA